jgi:hypothetical protein
MADHSTRVLRQADLDRRIAQLQAEITTLSRERNSLANVSCLPPEVLTDVFLHAHADITGHASINSASLLILWKALTHTCHQWREISLSTSQIWSVIMYTRAREQWAFAALQRVDSSGSQLLSIGVELGYPLPPDSQLGFAKQVVDRMSAVKRLCVTSLNTAEDSLIKPLLQSMPAPNLESLDLHNIPLSFVTFAGVHPHLSELRLSDCYVSWSGVILSNRFGQLSSLRLCGGGLYRRPESSEFVGMICGLERLQYLDMRDAGPLRYVGTSAVTSMHVAQAKPARLTTLVVRDDIDAFAATLMTVSVPHQTKVFIYIDRWPVDSQLSPEHRSAFETLGRERAKLDRSFHEVHLVGHASGLSWIAHVVEGPANELRSSDPWLNVEVGLQNQSRAQGLRGFFTAFRFSRTISLVLDLTDLADVPAFVWSNILQAFDLAKQLRIIGLRPEVCAALFSLSSFNDLDDRLSSAPTLDPHQLPLLTTLTVEGSRSSKLPCSDFMRWLKRRKELKNGIQHISLIRCRLKKQNFTAEQFKRDVEDCVPDVQWVK